MKKILTLLLIGIIIFPNISIAQIILDESSYDEEGNILPSILEQLEGEDSELTQEEFNALVEENPINLDGFKKGEIASCGEYYNPQSLDINITQDYVTYEPGDAILLKGTVTNTNSYPLIGVDVRARLIKNTSSSYYTLADINLAQDITLKAGEAHTITYSHLLPFNTPSGEYQIYFYAVEQDRYILSGSSVDLAGSPITFEVSGNNPHHIFLDQIMLGTEEQEVPLTDMLEGTFDVSSSISIPLYNPSAEAKEMIVTYDLYSEDASNPNNKISTKSETVTVEGFSEIILPYSIETTESPMYYLVVTAKSSGTTKDESVFKETTISTIRISTQNPGLPRINFSGVNTYPLTKGTEATLITCFQNMSEYNFSAAKIETILKDERGKIIVQTLYDADVPSEGAAIIQKFNPKKNLSNFTISTIIYDENNQIIDQIDKVYSCQDIDSSLCASSDKISFTSLIILVLGMSVLIGILFFISKKRGINIERV